ncbi:MAG: anaerobic carbon-monoxide dehydrogenase catalytic subunit [Candidatus Zipacnadales bacterium]
MSSAEKRSIDSASQQMLARAANEKIKTAWDRLEDMRPQCGFGQLGICCTICQMGPCRIDPFGKGAQQGVCGADAHTIAARNLLRKIAVGASAHSDHGRTAAMTLLEAAEGKNDYTIKDPKKLRKVAEYFGIDPAGKETPALAKAVAEAAVSQFGQQQGELVFLRRAPEARQRIWREQGLAPRGIDREIVTALHQTHMGVDDDFRSIMKQGMRTALADGWGGSMIATEIQDILFGSPEPIRAKTNLGVLKPDAVNVIVHGHEPVLSEMIAEAARDKGLIEKAKAAGATGGIQIAGLCCTANEILMRHGIPSAGSFLQQELAVMTGAVDLMTVDVQCWMPALTDLTEHFHTKLITTSDRAKSLGVEHIQFEESRALEIAKQIIELAIENYQNRDPARMQILQEEIDLIAGFTADYVFRLLGGTFRPSYRPLNNGIIDGRLRGVAGVVGCENPKVCEGLAHTEMIKELIANDVLVVSTGCSAIAAARAGLLQPESAFTMAGKGLQEICEAVGIPPVLHVGSCVDNSRILIACTEMVLEGGLGNDISELPVAGAAPEWMSEKAITIGWYVVASGIYTVFGDPQPIMGSPLLREFATNEVEKMVGARYDFESDPIKAARLMIEHMDKKREALKLRPMMYQPVAAG